jgi:hypothetical protein
MAYFRALGPFELTFRKSKQPIAAGDYLSLDDQLGRQGLEQGALVEVSAEEAKAAPAPSKVEVPAEPAAPRARRSRFFADEQEN